VPMRELIISLLLVGIVRGLHSLYSYEDEKKKIVVFADYVK